MKKIKVVELFAGVGGFRIGLNKASNKDMEYDTVWNNQWEPGEKKQYASQIYKKRFGKGGHSCKDIAFIVDNEFDIIPKHDLLVGGFPCQDYSVARTANQAEGLHGEKGVLWWSIYKILKKSGKNAPKFLMLENVDRLLKSPSKQRGRDFAVMLSSLLSLGYIVEWRVINAAEYGFPQRRRRVFILGYKKGTKLNKLARKTTPVDWVQSIGVIAKGFPVYKNNTNKISNFKIDKDTMIVSRDFSKHEPKISPFYNAGIMIDGIVYTKKVEAKYNGKKTTIRDILVNKNVPEEFFIDDKKLLKRWKYLKGSKSEVRRTKEGFEYKYSEGGMIFPDNLDNASRTIVTGEGGISPSRFKHVIKKKSGRLRRLMPIELERLCMFPDNHTKEVPDTKRAFIMGNALVVGVITKLGRSLRDLM